VNTADRIISIGDRDETLLLCNAKGLQIHKLVEIQPDALAVGTRYRAEQTLLGDIEQVCRALTDSIVAARLRFGNKRVSQKLLQTVRQQSDTNTTGSVSSKLPLRQSSKLDENRAIARALNVNPHEELDDQSHALWERLHAGGVSYLRWLLLHYSVSAVLILCGYLLSSQWEELPVVRCDTVSPPQCYESNTGYCHPACLLETFSRLRLDAGVGNVSKHSIM
jgi:hypothetical protein